MTITNKLYRQFIDKGSITLVNEDIIKQAINNVKEKYKTEGQVLILILYFTGARPAEILKLTTNDISKNKSYVIIQMQGIKRGLPRPIFLRYKNPLVKMIYNYSKSLPPNAWLFHHYWSKYSRSIMYKTKDGLKQSPVREEISNKLRYYFKKWFNGLLEEAIPPYYLRHNAFSDFALKGASDDEIMQLKGARRIQSVQLYKHLSIRSAKKLAKLRS